MSDEQREENRKEREKWINEWKMLRWIMIMIDDEREINVASECEWVNRNDGKDREEREQEREKIDKSRKEEKEEESRFFQKVTACKKTWSHD